MNYVLDASVAVASLRGNEKQHAAAARRLAPLLRGLDRIIVPAIFQIEVASALARAAFTPGQVDRFVNAFLEHAEVITLGSKRAAGIQRLTIATKLRAADAICVWLAMDRGVPLLTCDEEIAERANGRCEILKV